MSEFESISSRLPAFEESDNPLNAGVLSYDTPETVCGEDDRTQVMKTTVAPYFWICQLNIRFDQGSFVGSGWLCSTASVKYDVVATSGHCVFETSTGEFATSITVAPGRNGDQSPYGQYTVGAVNLRASANWMANVPDKADFDYGAILIPKTGYLGACGMWVAKDSQLKGLDILNAGYPGDKNPYGFLWEESGPVTSVSDFRVFYMNDTAGGESGSPALARKSDGKWWSTGIHGYGGCPNSAVRLTPTVFNDYINWGK